MRKLDNPEDFMRDIATYELDDGSRITLCARQVKLHGAAALIRYMGLGDKLPTTHVPVKYHGEVIGTFPPDFDPSFAKSSSFLYDVRPGDFRRDGDAWIAHPSLGPRDIEMVIGFSARR